MTTDTNYSYTGSIISLAGLVVIAASHFGVSVTTDQVASVLGGLVILYGVIHQAIAHHNLAVAAGITPKV